MRLKELAVGAKVKEPGSGIVFLVAEHRHPGYDGTMLVTDRVIRQACLDAPEPHNPSPRIRQMGNNYYPHANLHQWLNSAAADWYTPAHIYDAAPSEEFLSLRFEPWELKAYNAYDHEPGFLSRFPAWFSEAILLSNVPCIDRTMNAVIRIPAKAFCLSLAEIGVNPYQDLSEGSKVRLFDDFRMKYAVQTEECVEQGQFKMPDSNAEDGWYYWLRTPHPRDEGLSYYVHSTNPYCMNTPGLGYLGVRPAMNVDGALTVRYQDESGMYVFEEAV